MAEIKLYLDEDISPEVAVVLRSRGYNAVSAHEVGMRGKGDEEQLEYAIRNGRVLLTFNTRHFAPIAEEFYLKGKEHCGIVVSKKIGLKEIIKLTANMINKAGSDDLKNLFDWLQNYK